MKISIELILSRPVISANIFKLRKSLAKLCGHLQKLHII